MINDQEIIRRLRVIVCKYMSNVLQDARVSGVVNS